MANVTVCNVDDEVLASLKTQAKVNHRSLQGGIRQTPTQRALPSNRIEEFRERTARLHSLAESLPQTDCVDLIREDRDR